MNLVGFDEETVHEIYDTIAIFQHFRMDDDAGEWKTIMIQGGAFGKPQYDYYMHPFGSHSFNVQVCPKGLVMAYKFGIVFEKQKEPIPYHNPMD